MALQDNFNAIYNKETQNRKQKEELKAHDVIFENKLQNDLQTLQLAYIISNNNKTLIIPKIKNNLIDEVIKTQYDPINKKSKYINKEVQLYKQNRKMKTHHAKLIITETNIIM